MKVCPACGVASMQLGAAVPVTAGVPGAVVYLDGHALPVHSWPGVFVEGAPVETVSAVRLGATLQLEEEDRQMVILALARLAHERPGFEDALHRIARRIDNTEKGRAQMFDELRALAGRS